MTVSHLYFGHQLVDVASNVRVPYDSSDFKELVKLMALGSKASFSYQPSDEEIILFLTKQGNLPKPREG